MLLATKGNKHVKKTTKIGDIPGHICVQCDQHGNKIMHVMMKDVAMVPSSGYNLFSLTKMMLLGWKLIGEDNKLTLQKGGDEMHFGIAIPTPKGVIYAMYLKQDGEIAGAGTDSKIKLMIQQAHE